MKHDNSPKPIRLILISMCAALLPLTAFADEGGAGQGQCSALQSKLDKIGTKQDKLEEREVKVLAKLASKVENTQEKTVKKMSRLEKKAEDIQARIESSCSGQ